jgi:hypothetical protein
MDRAQDRLDIPSVTAKAQGLQSSLAVFLADEWGDELRTGSEELERVLKILEDDECGRLAVENRMAWRLNDRGRLLMHDKSPVEFHRGGSVQIFRLLLAAVARFPASGISQALAMIPARISFLEQTFQQILVNRQNALRKHPLVLLEVFP